MIAEVWTSQRYEGEEWKVKLSGDVKMHGVSLLDLVGLPAVFVPWPLTTHADGGDTVGSSLLSKGKTSICLGKMWKNS